jgi:hypothetical protein
MGTRVLRVNDLGMAVLELRRSRSKDFLRRFRRFIENTDWDERLLEYVRWVNGASLAVAGAAAILALSVGIRFLF